MTPACRKTAWKAVNRQTEETVLNKIKSSVPGILALSVLIPCLLAGSALASSTRNFPAAARAVDAEHAASSQDRRATAEEIQDRRAQLTRQILDLETALAAARQEQALGETRLTELSGRQAALKKEISASLSRKEELDIILRDTARNLLGKAENSPAGAENPEYLAGLTSILSGDTRPGMAELETLIEFCFRDIAVSGTRNQYTGPVLDRSGETVQAEITRLGHMAAIHRTGDKTGYLTPSPASGRLMMSAAPPFLVKRSLDRFLSGDTRVVPIDISGGIAVQQLSRQVSWMDQLKSGGILVIPILLVGLVALALTLERLVFLGRVRHNTDDLMTRVTDLVARGDFKGALETTLPHRNRPTGRVLMAGLEQKGQADTVIESALSEAILKETPRLERFLTALKVSAAVAPLLGLLGTVTGMINTFQVITTHGTGDPRLMAGGISEAMVTTQVGLAVAIPVMMVAAFLGRRAHFLARDMEEKGLALMAALLKLTANGTNKKA
jgi:biopolymer transport protein ExbB